MELQNSFLDNGLPAVYITLYADGMQLAECGSLDCTVIRFRIDKLQNASDIWTDFAIAPGLAGDEEGVKSQDLTDLRVQLVQRFLFLVFKRQ